MPFKGNDRNSISYGSGFLISNEGFITTNYHVVKDCKSIKFSGINQNFNDKFLADVVATDERNDLAIIRVKSFRNKVSLAPIPYVIDHRVHNPGSGIFCLGYPLSDILGKEVKVTNGIISSKSGFKVDITIYQKSAPVFPDNSGGPLFNEEGKVVGIITARFSESENVSYAVKSPYLLNLIQEIPEELRGSLNYENVLTTKSLADKVNIVKNYVCLIECME